MSSRSTQDNVPSSSSVKDEKTAEHGLSASLIEQPYVSTSPVRQKLPVGWRVLILALTCLCSFGNHWSNGLIIALKTTIIKEMQINNSEFATLVAVTNLANTFLCVVIGFSIDKWGGAVLSIFLSSFHLSGAMIMAGAATNNLNSYPVLIVGKVVAAVGDGSLDNAQHRVFSTYFARGGGFGFSIGSIWAVANLAQFIGQATANVMVENLGTYAWALWISAIISLFSLLCAISVFFLDRWLQKRYDVTDHTDGHILHGHTRRGVFTLSAIRHLPLTFWVVVLFAAFENAGVQSFVSISTQFAQQRLNAGAVIGGWVSSFYLLLPVGLTPFIGIYIDGFGQRVTLLFFSAITFFISMLLLKLSHSVPAFVAAYVFYALSQCLTPAPQVEIVRSIISDPQWFATAFAIKKSVVQASIVIITTAAGKMQDDTSDNSLDPGVILWLVYAAISVVISGGLLIASTTSVLPAARLAQVAPRRLRAEVERLGILNKLPGNIKSSNGQYDEDDIKEKEKILKSTSVGSKGKWGWTFMGVSAGIILIGWILFGLGVDWGVHGSVIAGTTGE